MIGENVRGNTYEERALAVIGLFIGIIGLAYFTGVFVQLIRALNDDTEKTVSKIASARAFCKRAGLKPKALTEGDRAP